LSLSPGTVLFNRYRIASKLGEGGYGVVYRAWDLRLNIAVALKENQDSSPEIRDQFTREAQILAALNHPHLPRVTDYFEDGAILYLVMDFIDGQDLGDTLRQNGCQDEARVLGWMDQIMDALIYLHRQNPPIIHRDLKPSNIRITSDGKAYLLDFGIAKLFSPGSKTVRGARGYTPPFAPFEQYGRASTDQRTDVYALGTTMYVLLTGTEPPESVDRLNASPLTPPRQLVPAISATTENAILKAMAVMPEDRFQSMMDFRAALFNKPIVLPPEGKKISTPLPPKPVIVSTTGEILVSKDGSGQCRTIGEAIAAAPSRGKILIKSGVYNESLRLSKPVSIMAEQSGQPVTLIAKGGTGIVVDTQDVTISGLQIQHHASDGGKQFCVDVVSGNVVFEDCDFKSETLSAVVVHGSAASPTFRRCRMHHSGECGVMFYDHAGGLLDHCEVYANHLSGMEIRQHSDPTIRNTRFYDGQQAGALIWSEGRGTLENCEFSGHSMSQIEVREKGNPTITRCKIHDGQSVVIYFQQFAGGTVSDCEIAASKLANIEIATKSQPTIHDCRIHDGSYPGIFVHDGGAGVIENCEVWGNSLAGMEVRSGATPVIRGCTFRNGQQCGVYFNEDAGGLMEDCEISKNAFSGIELKKCVSPMIRRTTTRDNAQCGVLVWSKARGLLEGCQIIGNLFAGIEIREGAFPMIKECYIQSNGYQGVWVYGDSGATIERCDLSRNTKGALKIEPGARVTRTGNIE